MAGRVIALAMLAAVMVAAAAAGDTVFMRDGRKFVGKVSTQEGKVKIEMAMGTTVVDRRDVIYISKGEVKPPPAAAPAPDASPAQPISVRPACLLYTSDVPRCNGTPTPPRCPRRWCS